MDVPRLGGRTCNVREATCTYQAQQAEIGSATSVCYVPLTVLCAPDPPSGPCFQLTLPMMSQPAFLRPCSNRYASTATAASTTTTGTTIAAASCPGLSP